jgi:hypothetical protein
MIRGWEPLIISEFIKGIKPEIRYQVQGQVQVTMERAIRLTKIQEPKQEKTKAKTSEAM